MCKIELNNIYKMDCFDGMNNIADKSIDMILCDLPYGETGKNWDKELNLSKLFNQYIRIAKDDAAIVLTGTFKFGVKLYNTAPKLYKYDWVWEKENGTNIPNVNFQPLRVHEYIYVFGKGRVASGKRTQLKYFPQKTPGTPYCRKRRKISTNWRGRLRNTITNNLSGERYPRTIQKFVRDKNKLHPTQKPIALFEYLIKTYTNENDVVLDNCIGSGTTAVACINTNRNFIGFETDKKYFDIACNRINEARNQVKS